MTFRRALLPIACVAAMATAGCVQEPAKPAGSGGRVVRADDGTTPPVALPQGDTPPNALDALDPIGARLQDAGGLMILYHAQYGRMPATLDALKPLAQPFQANEFSEPATGKPFVYLPQAQRMGAGDTRVVAYAPTPDADGKYKGLLLRLAKSGQSPACWVVTLSQLELQGHIGSTPPATRPG